MMIHPLHKEAGFTPQGHRVLLKIHKVEEKTDGGIILPDELREKLTTAHLDATVLAMGESAFAANYLKPKIGDVVKIVRYAGNLYDGEDKEPTRIVNDEDIVAVNRVFDVEKELEMEKENG